MKRREFLGISALAIGGGFLPSLAFGGEKLTLKLGNVNAASSHISTYGYDKFAELVGEKSGGDIVVHHFPGGQLGSDKETYEAAQQGMLEIASGSFANIVTLTRAFEPLHLPYMFESREQAHRLVDSAAFKAAVNEQLNQIGLHWFVTFDYGFRKIGTTNTRVVTPADTAGLKLRASRSPTEIAALEAFGAAATTIDWPEVYNALKLGIVDGEAVPPNEFHSSKHSEVIRYITNNDFQFLASISVISLEKWNGYSNEVRALIEESAAEAQNFHRTQWVDHTAKSVAEMKELGVEFIDVPVDVMPQWIERGRGIWADSGVPQEMIDLARKEATAA